ncbi:MAG: protein kinase [Candidatus Eiseniibacteriota bacterium]|nr:MAG: protein kinase [Candidatus Eisenbacteria bacterium]
MISKTISHYKILEKLGEGGMGVVYKAQDTKLDRTVALKFLPPELLRDADAKTRFIHEAKAAAALSHPNICTIFEIDEAEGQTFIAMEYVEGKSLKEQLRSGPLKLDEATTLAAQVAEGLREAHEKGITHRDIKSANVMVTLKGQAKIMDFGLAKLTGRTQVTKAGTTVGTTGYMSPEQARGDETDSRTDIWSLGVVLYEMLTGRLPFKGDYAESVVYSILNETPEPVTSLRTGVPMDLERIVDKCLEKNPAERYQTAADITADLRRLERTVSERSVAFEKAAGKTRTAKRRIGPWVAAAAFVVAIIAVGVFLRYYASARRPVSSQKMLVVLPFENLGSSDDEYFAGGITDAITARLAGLHGLGVISRQSAVQYKGSKKSIKEIGRELGVEYILEGTVQRERPGDPASRVRVIPQLIRVSDDTHVWAATYDESMEHVFEVQSSVAEQVALELDIALLEPERKALGTKLTENIGAYEYYLRGQDTWERMGNVDGVLRMYEKAVELDPDFAAAWAGISRCHTWFGWIQARPGAIERARAASDKAFELDPDLPETHIALGFLHYQGSRDYQKAMVHFKEAQKRRPSEPEAERAIGYILRRQGKWEEGLTHLVSALQMDPRSVVLTQEVGYTYQWLGNYSEAEQYYGRAMLMAPTAAAPYAAKASVYLERDGNVEKAEQILNEAFGSVNLIELSHHMGSSGHPSAETRILAETFGRLIDPLTLATSEAVSAWDSVCFCLNKAELSLQRGNAESAKAYYDSARVFSEEVLQSETDAESLSFHYINLGAAHAGLGLKEEAIREGKKAVKLLPVEKDAISGATLRVWLAEIYVRVGEYEAAINELEALIAMPAALTVPLLRLDPIWDPLRDHPRFQRLLEKHSEEAA